MNELMKDSESFGEDASRWWASRNMGVPATPSGSRRSDGAAKASPPLRASILNAGGRRG